jgi:serine protease Do
MSLMRWLAIFVLVSAMPALCAAEETGLDLRRTPVVRAFEKTRDSVVNIACTQVVERDQGMTDLFDSFFDWRFTLPDRKMKYAVTSVGSGFVIHEDGYVITNAHVVMKTVDQQVIFVDGTEYKAQPVAVDLKSDLAVLKIQANRPLPHIPLGRSDDLMIGETVLAIGNPLGYHHSLTTGVISALDRNVEVSRGVEYRNLIQTDAPINPGNSGGPLLNVLGELIGVTSAIRGDAQNIGFAIPVDTLRDALPGMISLERLKRVQVGLTVGGRQEARVVKIDPNSPAEKSGINVGDRIRAIDGHPIDQDLEVYFQLLAQEGGNRVVLQIERAGQTLPVTLTLKGIPIPNGAQLARQRFGLAIAPLKSDISGSLGLEGGLFIEAVEPGSPAGQARIHSGMIVVTIAGDFPKDLDHVGLLLENVKAGETVTFHIWDLERYGGRLLIRPYEIPLKAR